MKITKFAHCSLLLEIKDARLLTDPGNNSDAQNDLTNLDAILFTHEHADHFHLPNLIALRKKNPDVQIIGNSTVAPLLEEAGIPFTLIKDQETITIKGITIKGFEETHAAVFRTMPGTPNTGFLVDEYLFYPGDAFIEPHVPVTVLALPVAGPWLKPSESIEYALKVAPAHAFPVHDAQGPNASALVSRIGQAVFAPVGIQYHTLPDGESLAL